MAMEDCCEEAYEAQELLRNGTRDLPRMKKILENQRVFLLVNESTVKKYQADIADEIEPSISELIERAEQGLKALEKKESALQAKVESAQLRANMGTTAQKMEARRLKTLTKQREKLEEEVKTLEAEVVALVAYTFLSVFPYSKIPDRNSMS